MTRGSLSRIEFLKQVSPFQIKDPRLLDRLAKSLQDISCQSGEVILRQGEVGDGCFLIVSGSVEILQQDETGETKQVAVLEKGSLFGETALLTNSPRNATVRALETVQLLKLNKEDLRRVMEKDPYITHTLFELLNLRDRPRQKKGMTSQTIAVEGFPTTVLKDSERGAYYRLSSEGLFVWQLLDGTHNLRDLALLYFQKFHQFAPHTVAEMIAGLVSSGFAVGNMSRLDQTMVKKSFLGQFLQKLGALFQWKMMIRNVDPLMERIYHKYFRWFTTWPAQLFFIFFNGVGFFIFFAQWGSFRSLLVSDGWDYFLLLLVPLTLLSVFIHEMGHALTVKAFGREVLSVGLGWYWISPIFYVDTSDMWLEKRWPRIAVSLAGPYLHLIFVNLISLIGFFIQGSEISRVFLIFTAASYVLILMNLNPILKYDGYYALQDFQASH